MINKTIKQERYYVYNKSTGYTRFVHVDKQQARTEAERLAKANPDTIFQILKVIAEVIVLNTQWTEFEDFEDFEEKKEEIPF